MKHLSIKCLAVLLIALLLAPAALAEADVAPVEAIDEAVPEADSVELDSVELDADDELPVEAGLISGESYQAELPSFEETGNIPIDEAHFPDPVVRSMFLNGTMHLDGGVEKPYDQNHNGWLDTFEIAEITDVSVFSGASDLSGLEVLTALNHMGIYEFTGTTIDLSVFPNMFSCSIMKSDTLTTAILPANINDFQISSTPRLTTLDISRCTRLQGMRLETGMVESMDLSGHPNMGWIICNSKALKSLKVGYQPKLFHLECCDNAMTSLDISGCPRLLSAIKDEYKKSYNAGDGKDYARVRYSYGEDVDDNHVEITISPTTELITGGKENAPVTLVDDYSITTSAVSAKATVKVGQSYTFSALDQSASGFKSSDSKVATVNKNGKIKPKKAGKVKITYKVNGKTRTISLTVKDPTVPTKVSLNMTGTNAVKVGDKITLTATLNEGGVSGIKWTTSDKKIATVKNGVVTFKKAGKVTITATTKRGNKKAKVKFTVSK